MKLSDLVNISDTDVVLTTRLWAWAMLLGEARTVSNNERRHRRSDRGGFNSQVDLLGALGELFLLNTVVASANSNAATDYMRDHLYRERGGRGVKGSDLSFLDDTTKTMHKIDVKTFDCSPNKKFFAINDNKHRSLAGQCSAYLCIVAPPLGRQMAVAKLVPYDDVEQWTAKSLRWNGSPSRNLPLQDFLDCYFSSPPKIEALRSNTFPIDEVEEARADSNVRSALVQLIPSLQHEGAPARENSS